MFAGALWALLPVVARGPLGLGAGGYGLLLAAVGIGAVLGALVVPMVRRRFGPGAAVSGGALLYAAATVVTGSVSSPVLATGALVLSGVAWIAVLSTLNAAAQVALPEWPRARALAYYQLAFMGGQALGGALWGAVAQAWSTRAALVAVGVGIAVLEPAVRRWLPLRSASPDVRSLRHLPLPPEVPTVPTGRVLVVSEWRVPAESAVEFVDTMTLVGQARRRTGARLWGLFQDLEDPECYLEVFTVTDWTEHLRQHLERGTAMDRDAEEAARKLTVPGTEPRVRHLVLAGTARG
jgi:MFS family permease